MLFLFSYVFLKPALRIILQEVKYITQKKDLETQVF